MVEREGENRIAQVDYYSLCLEITYILLDKQITWSILVSVEQGTPLWRVPTGKGKIFLTDIQCITPGLYCL